jgi:prevent-host-death family protein
MESLNIAEGQARFSELVTRAESGETVEITRGGRPVCKLVPIESPRQPIDWEAIRAFAATLPYDPTNSVEEMRKLDRY